MYCILNFLEKNLAYLLIVYLLVQLIYITFFPVRYQSDSLYYYTLAEDCINAGSFYPAPQHIFEDYIVAPLYVNLLVLVLRLNNSIFMIGLLNIILNFLQLFFLYKISEKIFDKSAAKLAIIVYIFYLNNLGLVLLNYTELLFGVLVFASVNSYIRDTPIYNFLSGVFVGASIAVRPLGWTLLTAYFLIFSYQLFRKTKLGLNFLRLSFGLIIVIFLFGLFNKVHFGKFIYTSTTGPVNLLIGANDDATGAYNDDVFEKGKSGFIVDSTEKTYIEKGDIWRATAIDWIKENPIKWLSLIPAKAFYLFLWDDIGISPLMNLQHWDLFHVAKHLILKKTLKGLMSASTLMEKTIYLTLQTLNYLYYFLVMYLIVKGIIYLRKSRRFNVNRVVLILFSLLGVVITIIIYGLPRYKYPFIISLLPYAAFKSSLFLNHKQITAKEMQD